MARRREEEKVLDVNAAMQGSLVFSDPVNLRINGQFKGTLTTKGSLIIGRGADVTADIIGEDITISGNIKGNIRASRMLRLTAGACVTGNVEVSKISIEEGAIFNGQCKTLEGRISLEELSDFLSVEENKIVEWVDSGKIPVEKEGDKMLFDRKKVESWIAQKT